MSKEELRHEAYRLGIAPPDNDDELRRLVKAELERRWSEENQAWFEYWNRWIEEHGLPLERYRLF